MESTAVLDALDARRPGWSLERALYTDPLVYELELAHIWHREWVVACAACELRQPGDYVTVQVGAYPIVVVCGNDGELRALHNVCRHRGSVLCEEDRGRAGRRLVCPYHQWSYHLDGRFAGGRDVGDVDHGELGLAAAHCTTIGGLVFVSVATEAPDIEPLRTLVEPYLAPFDLAGARVGHVSTVVEHANWKLVMENNRECHHCRSAHPELCVSFPSAPTHSGGGDVDERRRVDDLVAACEHVGLPSRFAMSEDLQYRVMRMPLDDGATSMTIDGRPAVDRRFGTLPDRDVGDVLLYHYPSTWNHVMADHALVFRMLPLGPDRTELRTTWLVPPGGDCDDLDRLTTVWLATNRQDTALVERVQRGVSSPAYRPGPYSPVEEDGVVQFVDWYAATLRRRLAADVRG